MAKKSAASRLELAREKQAAATQKISALETERNAALLADNDDLAVKLLDKLEALRSVARGYADKIALLSGEAEREKAESILRNHRALVDRFCKTLEGSDADLTEAADLIGKAWKTIASGIDKRERARAAFSVWSSHARAAAESIDGAAMSAGAVMALLAYEFYRISARPLLGGVPGAKTRPALPGALCPRIEWQLQPDKIMPFTEKLRTASKFAVDTLRQEIGNSGEVAALAPAPPALRNAADIQREVQAEAEASEGRMLPPEITTPARPTNGAAEPRERTPEQHILSELLQKANILARDVTPEGEKKYLAVMAQIPAAEAAANASIAK